MRITLTLVGATIGAGLLLAAAPLSAHHAFAAAYDESVVWGTNVDESVVWGTTFSDDSVVWGTSHGGSISAPVVSRR